MEHLPLIQLVSEEQRDRRRQIQESFHQNVGHYHQVMLLVAAILGFVVPDLHSQGPSLMNPWFLRAAAMALGFTLLIGVLIHGVSKWTQVWLTVKIEQHFKRQNDALTQSP